MGNLNVDIESPNMVHHNNKFVKNQLNKSIPSKLPIEVAAPSSKTMSSDGTHRLHRMLNR